MDMFTAGGSDYLVMVDRHSGYPWVHSLTSTTSLAVTRAIKKWFEYFSLPKSIRSDGRPQFRGETFKTYCKDNGILHETSSPYNPESNGLAEAAVKNVKKLLVKCIKEGADFQSAFAEFRNCPRSDGCSPSHIMFRRGTRAGSRPSPQPRTSPLQVPTQWWISVRHLMQKWRRGKEFPPSFDLVSKSGCKIRPRRSWTVKQKC